MGRLARWAALAACVLAALAGCAPAPMAAPMAHTAVVVQVSGQNSPPAYLFVSNRFVNRVYRIDLATQDFHTIVVGAKPHNLAASPDGSQVAVCNEDDAGVSVIQSTTMLVRNVATGAYPIDARYSPDGKWLAVANYDAQSVTLIDPSTYETWSVWVGGGPSSVAFDARSQTVAVACFNENSVALIDVTQQEVVATWDLSQYEPSDESLLPQTVSFGPPGTPFTDTMFVGFQSIGGEQSQAGLTYAHSIAVVPFPSRFYDDPSIVPTDVQIVRAGPNPSGFLWNHEGTAMLAFNHGEATDSGVVDTVSEVEWTDQNAPTPPPPAAKFGIAALADLNLLSPLANWFEKRRFIVGQNPAGAALAQGRDFVAVANEDSHSISLIDMADNSVQMIGVAASPYAVAFSPSGRYVFVVHETPLMPVSLVDTQTGGAWILYKSLSMYRWIQ